MAALRLPLPKQLRTPSAWLLAVALILSLGAIAVQGRQNNIDVLHIGTSGSLTTEGNNRNEKSSLDTLKGFIKDETGLTSDIARQKDWNELGEKMSKGELQVGVFRGVEFARAKERYADLKPIAVAVNIYVYPVVYVVTAKDNKATDFAGLQGQSLATVAGGPEGLSLFVEKECQAANKKPDAFFSKITTADNFEDVIDDAVDGTASAALADRAALDAYKRRKPGRFNRLKPIAQSKPFPPAVIAHYGKFLDEATLTQFRDGLINASTKEKGQTMLTLFRLTGFQSPPSDLDSVLTEARKTYGNLQGQLEKGK